MSNSVNCSYGRGIPSMECHKLTTDPSARCHLHRNMSSPSQSKGGLRVSPVPPQQHFRHDEKQLALFDSAKEIFNETEVNMHYGIITAYTPGKKTFFNRNPKGSKVSVYFEPRGMAVEGSIKAVDRQRLQNSFRSIYPQ